MPVAFFNSGTQTGAVNTGARTLIPGVTPGGQFAGKAKPAILIEDAWFIVTDFDLATEDFHAVEVYLKLSQELDLTPGFLLPLGQVYAHSDGALNPDGGPTVIQMGDKLAGTVWAPRVVGLRFEERGAVVQFSMHVYLQFRRIWIPWRDWFVHWEFLDGIVDNDREY